MRSFVNILLKTLLLVSLAFVTLWVMLQLPPVQTYMVQRAAKWATEKLGMQVAIGQASIKWFDTLTFEDVRVRDYQNRPMINIGRLEVDYNLANFVDFTTLPHWLTDLFMKPGTKLRKPTNATHLDAVVLYKPNVQLVYSPKTGDLNLDDFISAIERLTSDPATANVPSDMHAPFTIGEVAVVDGFFSMDDPREAYMKNPKDFDYNHLRLSAINGDVTNFLVLGDTIALDVARLRTVDRQTGLTVKRMDTKFLYSSKKMEFANLYMAVNNSVIRKYVAFLYNTHSDMGDFNTKVAIRANFDNSIVRSADLGAFSEYIRGLNETWFLTGTMRGRVVDLSLVDTDLRFGPQGRSRLVGDLAFKGLPDMDNLLVNLKFRPSLVTMADIRQYYPEPSFNKTMAKLGTLAFNANFAGAFDNFTTDGQFSSALGRVAGKLKLKLADNPDLTTYEADLTADNFKIGELIDQPGTLQAIDGRGRLKGQGTDLSRAQADVDGQFARFGFGGYDYKNLVVQGNLQKAYFDGHVALRDPNAKLNLDGEFDLRGPSNHFDVRGTIQEADLRALGYTTDSLTISTYVNAVLEGNSVDQLTGDAKFREAFLTLNGRNLAVDTLSVVSTIEGTQSRYLNIDSDFLSARLQGNYQPKRTIADLTRLVSEYKLYFAGDAVGRKQYYADKLVRSLRDNLPAYHIDYLMAVRNVAPLLTFLNMPAYLSTGTRLAGRYNADNTQFITANVTTDSLRIADYAFGPTELDLTTSKFTNSEEVLASAIISSVRQKLGGLAPTQNLDVEASWEQDHINFTSRVDQTGTSNRADLNGELRFKGDAIDLTFRQSKLRLLDTDWTLNPESLVRMVGNEFTLQNVTVSNQNQFITASGKVSADSAARLNLEARSFQLSSLNPVLNTKLGGLLNGTVQLRNLYKAAIVESQLNVAGLAYEDAIIGDLVGSGAYDPIAEQVIVDARLIREQADVFTLRGTYTPGLKTNSLALRALFNNTELKLAAPFTKGLFSNFGGTLVGQVDVKGTPKAPLLSGSVDIKKGRTTFDYLKADLFFDNTVYFGDNEIVTRRMVLRDPEGNTAIVRGGVYHDNFKFFQLGFDADLQKFRIMNTTAKDNDLFYGQAVITGKAELFGPLDNLTVQADMQSNKGTRMYIPLDGAASVSQQDYIQFASRRTAAKDSVRQSVDLSGIKMDFKFDITPDAYCEVQFDRQSGDIIRTYGEGRIAMNVDTKGDFRMTGTYGITQGDYTFTFQNLLNKKFQIRPNSRITWTGDPYGALIDVTAAYTQFTALGALLPTSGTSSNVTNNSPDRTRRYPVDLLIKLTGQLTTPDVGFDLKVKEYPASSEFRQAVTAFENRLQSNDQELTKQVSSLLIFNQLIPEGSNLFSQDVQGGVGNAFGEILSNRLSQLFSNVDEKLNVGVSLGSIFGTATGTQASDNLLNNLQLRVSYRLLNDRLRVSRDGGFTYGQSQASAASLLGEWTLEYWLTPDGRLRAKMYNRNQQSALGALSLGSTTLTTSGGLSVLYTRSFNRLLFGSKDVKPGIAVPEQPAPPTTGTQPLATPPPANPPTSTSVSLTGNR
ncbi:translocation/assembly module TamB domain-containing protein [Fibrivirga algicola]|uniref:Translocation/assembly module TamB n=1 Tax=Fibrivirga algicola TaxID=2950420 RepID=A0ABX0Q9B8_9BACT|nr:translocation/assembly module TamB domain-containing protein [Fibrivirga algicola]NID08660.1 translocation/assembly module TamB [Fibrivirga algicola]